MSHTPTIANQRLIRPHHRFFVLLQRLLDVAMIAVTHGIVSSLYSGAEWQLADTMASGMAGLLFVLVGDTLGLYKSFRDQSVAGEWRLVFATWCTVVGVLLLAAFALKESATYSRVVMLGWFAAAPIAISIWRAVERVGLRELRRRGYNSRRAAIMGMTQNGERVAERIRKTPSLGLNILGYYDDRDATRCYDVGEEAAGGFDDLIKGAREGLIDVVYVCLPMRAEQRVNDMLRELADTTVSVHIVPDFLSFDLAHGRWSSIADIPTVSIFETPFMGASRFFKRVSDIVLGGAALLIASIPMLFIAIGVKRSSKGPVLFRQRRYGLNGSVIHVWKFRTMTVAEDGADVKQATKNDSRVTKFGAFLRRNSLDELPQLIHVVAGSMSLVGPRPHAVAHNEEYRKRIHGYMLRHKVKPGLTGWAQVNGWRGETDTLEKMEMRIEHDLDYIRRWDLLLDFKIVFLTIFGQKVRKNAH